MSSDGTEEQKGAMESMLTKSLKIASVVTVYW